MYQLSGIGRARPLREQVAEALRDAIVNMRFLPGQMLVEGDLCEMFGISRASLRQALRVLESEGLVEAQNGKGILVSVLDRKTALDLYSVRESLEGNLARAYVAAATESDLAELDTLLDSIDAAMERAEANNELLRIMGEAYDHVLGVVDNEALERFLRMIYRRIPQLRAITVNFPGRSSASFAEFQAFAHAAKAKDADAAAQALEQHVRNAAKVVERVLEEE